MPKVVRKGDRNSAGGVTLSGDKTLIIDGRPVSPIGTPVSPHLPCPKIPAHCNARTMQGSKSFIIGNKKVNVVGDVDTCGHARIEGSSTFIIGNR